LHGEPRMREDPSYYLWEVEGSPAVRLSLSFVDRLRRILPDGPDELTGLLLGTHEGSGTITIENFEAGAETHGVDQRKVAGCFFVRSYSGSHMQAPGTDLLEERLAGRSGAVLAIRRNAPGVPAAAFFFWDGTVLDSSFAALPFPFDSGLLNSEGHPVMHAERAASEETARELPMPALRKRFSPDWKKLGEEAALFGCAVVLVGSVIILGRHISAPATASAPAPERMTTSVAPAPAGTPIPDGAAVKNDEPARLPERPASVPANPLRSGAANKFRSKARARPNAGAERKNFPDVAGDENNRRIETPAVTDARPGTDVRAGTPAVNHLSAPLRSMPAPAVRRPTADVSFQPVHRSLLGKTLRHIPLLSRLQRDHSYQDDFVPARLRRQNPAEVPPEMSRHITGEVPVDLRIRITPSGEVAETELISRNINPAFSSLALRTAAKWNFEPARNHNKAVSSDMVVHFLFRPASE
jgi:TonB family protein